MAPKQDLSGGNASVDSFAISRNAVAVSMSRCLFTEQSRKLVNAIRA